MGPRQPWDEMGLKFPADQAKEVQLVEIPEMPEKIDTLADMKYLSQKTLFGVLTGSLTGVAFGVVDILRDSQAMKSAVRNNAVKRVFKSSYQFGGFFGAYHCILQSAKFLNPTPNATEMNVGIASVSTLAPLVTLPKLRPLLPYAVMLIVLDVINGMGTF